MGEINHMDHGQYPSGKNGVFVEFLETMVKNGQDKKGSAFAHRALCILHSGVYLRNKNDEAKTTDNVDTGTGKTATQASPPKTTYGSLTRDETPKQISRMWARAAECVSRVRSPGEGVVFLKKSLAQGVPFYRAVAMELHRRFSATKIPNRVSDVADIVTVKRVFRNAGGGTDDSSVELNHVLACGSRSLASNIKKQLILLQTDFDMLLQDARLDPVDPRQIDEPAGPHNVPVDYTQVDPEQDSGSGHLPERSTELEWCMLLPRCSDCVSLIGHVNFGSTTV